MKLHKFFVSCLPGFEKVLFAEIERAWPLILDERAQFQSAALPEFVLHKGGLEFETTLTSGFQLNFFLKTAHRVILRLGSFKASRYDILQMETKRLKKQWSLEGMAFRFKTETHESRLNHKRNIEEALGEVFKKTENEIAENLLLVRIVQDQVTLSLDTTGEHLHKRGWGSWKERAPLRETLAHLMLTELLTDVPAASLGSIQLVDPFCGSGTLLTEAGAMNIPMMEREFSFQNFHFCPKILKSSSFRSNYQMCNFGIIPNLLGCDFEEKEAQTAAKNLDTVQGFLSSWKKNISFQVLNEDSFLSQELRSEIQKSEANDVMMISNLPYGERLKKPQDFENNLVKLVQEVRPSRACFLGQGLQVLKWAGYRQLQCFSLSNQGIAVELLVIALDK